MARGSIRRSKRQSGWTYSITYDVGQQWDATQNRLIRKQKTERVPENTKKAAQELLAKRLAEVAGGLYRDDGGLTVAAFAQKWLDSRQVRPGTRASDQYCVARLVKHLGGVPLGKLRPDQIAAWRTALAQDYAPRTVRLTLETGRKILKTAVVWGYLRTNPAEVIPNPKIERREVAIFSKDEIRALLTAAGDWAVLVRLTATTGLRRGEVLGAQWAYLDLGAGEYTVAHTIDPTGQLGPPKTGKPRTVPLGATTVQALTHYKAQQAAAILRHPRFVDNDFLFPTQTGAAYHPSSFRNIWLAICEKAGLGVRRFHDLRHTCASMLLEQGARIDEVQQILGHSTPTITLNTYAHLMPGATNIQVARLDEAI